MKKILFILFASVCITIFKVDAQVTKTTPSMGKQHPTADGLLQKSKKQKTTAWILLGAGAATMLTGYIMAENAFNENDPWTFFGAFSPQAQTGTIIFLAGGAMVVGSVPFFISSGKNKRKANVIIKNESAIFLHPSSSKVNFYVVGVQIKL